MMEDDCDSFSSNFASQVAVQATHEEGDLLSVFVCPSLSPAPQSMQHVILENLAVEPIMSVSDNSPRLFSGVVQPLPELPDQSLSFSVDETQEGNVGTTDMVVGIHSLGNVLRADNVGRQHEDTRGEVVVSLDQPSAVLSLRRDLLGRDQHQHDPTSKVPEDSNVSTTERQLATMQLPPQPGPMLAQINVRDEVQRTVHVEAATHNGVFVWRIPCISQRRRDAVEERTLSLYSPPFYTSRNGYKMRLRMYLNGDGIGKGTHISLFFVLMKGEFDSMLSWPFKHKVTFTLIDQNNRNHIVQALSPSSQSPSFQQPISDMNIASGCPQFARQSVLVDEGYTRDDCLFIRCKVDTIALS